MVTGHPTDNFETMKRMVACAKREGAQLVVFPEMCVGGYFLADKWADEDYVDYLASFNDRIRELSDGIGIIFGNVERTYLDSKTRGKDGRRAR